MRITRTVGVVFMSTCVFAASAAAGLTTSQEPRDDKQGVKETEQFIKKGDDVAHAVGVAKTQIDSTMTAYNTLVSTPSTNMKGDYGKLLKEMKKMDDKVADARKQLGEMEAAANTYFAGREATIAKIQNPELKKQAEQRLADSKKQHADVLAAMRSAGESLEPIRKDLEDQIKFLGSDLNPSAAASQAANAQKLNERGKVTFAKTDEAVNAATTYFNAMRPSK
jgi:hypothetical protein